MRILIIKFGALGDVVRTTYILKGLHKKYQDLKVDWLTSNGAFDLLRFNPYINILATKDFLLSKIRQNSYDLVISLDDELEVLQILQDIKTKQIFGAYLNEMNKRVYSEDSGLWFDMGLLSVYGKEKADQLKKENQLEHNQIFAHMLDIEISTSFFYNSKILEERISKNFKADTFKIGLNSGSGGRWESKKLPIDETIKLINFLLSIKIKNKNVEIYLLGGEDEKDRNKEIVSNINNENLKDAGTDNSLLEFAAIIKNMDYLISSDSLALHLGIAQGVKNLSFYAPTSAAEIGTFGFGVKVVSTSEEYCNYKKDSDNSSITAERIFEVFKKHIGIA
jgi:heptosyltransferase-2